MQYMFRSFTFVYAFRKHTYFYTTFVNVSLCIRQFVCFIIITLRSYWAD